MKNLLLKLALPLILLLLLTGCTKPVTLYTDADVPAVQNLVAPFSAKTGIPVDVVGFKDVHELADAIAVYADGKYTLVEPNTLYNPADVVFSTEMQLGDALKSRDALQQYTPAAAPAIPSGAKLDGWWYGTGGHVWVVAWNTDLVKAPVPSSLLDLANASFPSKAITMLNPNYLLYYTSGVCAIAGRDKSKAFLQTLIGKDTDWEAMPDQTALAIAGSRAWAGLTTLAEAEKQKKAGAHIAWAVPDQGSGGMGAFLQFNVVCLSKSSTTPDEGKQLADYLLDPATEALSVQLGLSDATLRNCGSTAPVVLPLQTNLAAAQDAMQNEIPDVLTYFTSVNPDYKGK